MGGVLTSWRGIPLSYIQLRAGKGWASELGSASLLHVPPLTFSFSGPALPYSGCTEQAQGWQAGLQRKSCN